MDQQASTASWQLTVIMTVIASWVFYRYAAPKGWRECREDRLATDGLYGIVRHPQYTGILIALFGQLNPATETAYVTLDPERILMRDVVQTVKECGYEAGVSRGPANRRGRV